MIITQHQRGNLIDGDLFWDISNPDDVDDLEINLIKKEN